jgi:hypothetical protein
LASVTGSAFGAEMNAAAINSAEPSKKTLSDTKPTFERRFRDIIQPQRGSDLRVSEANTYRAEQDRSPLLRNARIAIFECL